MTFPWILKIYATIKKKVHIKATCDTTFVHKVPGITVYPVNTKQLRTFVPALIHHCQCS
jgi:hypothetical protein